MDENSAMDIYKTLKFAHNHVKHELRNKLLDYNITWPQFHALYHVKEEGITTNELSKELRCNASNMTGLIDRMIANNWVYREQSTQDRRVWLIKLTAEGSELKERLIPEHRKNIENRMNVLSEEELLTLKILLDKLINGEEESNK